MVRPVLFLVIETYSKLTSLEAMRFTGAVTVKPWLFIEVVLPLAGSLPSALVDFMFSFTMTAPKKLRS